MKRQAISTVLSKGQPKIRTLPKAVYFSKFKTENFLVNKIYFLLDKMKKYPCLMMMGKTLDLQSQTITLDSVFLFPHTACPMLFCRFKKISKEKSTSL